jgi:cyclohexa-1,5-dienecarbonyl-CoA hydratase
VNASEALGLGLLHSVTEDPEAACLSYIERSLLPLSASSLRFAERAARTTLTHLLRTELPKLEQLYLEELMATADASEGIAAFLAKRPPRYANEGV